MNGKPNDPSLENSNLPPYPDLSTRVTVLEVRMSTVEKDVAVIRATCATKDDITMLLERMNQQHVTLLDRMEQQRVDLLDRMDQQRVALLERMDQQHISVLEKIGQLNLSMKEDQARMYQIMKEDQTGMHRFLTSLAWRLYGLIALAMSGAFFVARYVH